MPSLKLVAFTFIYKIIHFATTLKDHSYANYETKKNVFVEFFPQKKDLIMPQ